MELPTFLSILGASVGFISAAFFAFGAASLTAKDIYSTVVVRHTINEHWYNAASNQRAEYIAGSVLLLLAFLVQIASSLVSKGALTPFFSSPACAWASLVLLVLVLLIAALLLRQMAAVSCSSQVREMWAREIASREQQNAE